MGYNGPINFRLMLCTTFLKVQSLNNSPPNYVQWLQIRISQTLDFPLKSNQVKWEIEMDKCDRKIQVRTLSGETTTVSVSSDKSIHELKLLLKISFPPASSSPNFHLFFKATTLFIYICLLFALILCVCPLVFQNSKFK